jgi:hypothetical protein
VLIILTRDDKPQGSVWGQNPKEAARNKETWRVLNAFRLVNRSLPPVAAILIVIRSHDPRYRFHRLNMKE